MTYNVYRINEANEFFEKELLTNFNADIYHTKEWVSSCELSEGEEVFYLLIVCQDEKAFFPLIKRLIKNTDYFDLFTPYGYGGVAFSLNASADFKLNTLNFLKNYLIKTNCVSVFLRLHPLLNHGLDKSPFYFDNGLTLSVDLNREYSEIQQEYSSGHKYDLKKSNKNNDLILIDDEGFSYYTDFLNIYIETMKYLSASEFYFFNENYFLDLKDKLGKNLKLVVVKCGNQVIGASLFLLHNTIIQYHLSGTSIEGRKYQPSKIILDYMIKWGIENKYSVLHLGGGIGGNTDALYKFKKGFSSTDMKFSTIRMVVNEDAYQELSLKSGFSIDKISNLSDFFPIYRKS